MAELAVVILAAGKGTRMLSRRQKILHEVGGRPMVSHVLESALQVADLPPLLVVGPGENGVQELFGERAGYVLQPEQLGTGHATMMAAPALEGRSRQVLVTYADMPLLRANTMSGLAERQRTSGAAVVMLTVMGEPGSTFGRVVRGRDGQVLEIVEVAEARRRPEGDALLAIRELNAGVYCFDADWLWQNLDDLPLRRARSGQEYYLTDMIGIAVSQDRPVEARIVDDADECLGAGTRAELVVVEKAFRRRANALWLSAGVTLIDPETTHIDQTATIGQDTVIWPNTYLQGQTTVGQGCVLGPNAVIRDTTLGDECRIEGSIVERCVLGDGAAVPPFSHVVDEQIVVKGPVDSAGQES
ncbi:MAG: NTP transferase domain-containing protein [Chloroflexota bacterium]|nr:MAG: NTP transferase domain-containing protein [Chloroflexota bacterium]